MVGGSGHQGDWLLCAQGIFEGRLQSRRLEVERGKRERQ